VKRTIDGWIISKNEFCALAERGGVTLCFSAGALEVSLEAQLDPGGRSLALRFPDEWSVPLEVVDALREMTPPTPPEAHERGPGIAALDLPKPVAAYWRHPR
jgi:hypothetical protein